MAKARTRNVEQDDENGSRIATTSTALARRIQASRLGTDPQVETLADLLIACGAADELPELARAVYTRWLDAITRGCGKDVLKRVARLAAVVPPPAHRH